MAIGTVMVDMAERLVSSVRRESKPNRTEPNLWRFVVDGVGGRRLRRKSGNTYK